MGHKIYNIYITYIYTTHYFIQIYTFSSFHARAARTRGLSLSFWRVGSTRAYTVFTRTLILR
jgi:hypothetical protein